MNLPSFLVNHPDGEVRVVGRRISLYTLMRDYLAGFTAEKLAEGYQLPLDTIRGTIAFYHQNREEVDRYVENYGAELTHREISSIPGPGVTKLGRLQALIRDEDSLRTDDPEWGKLSLLDKALRLQHGRSAETT